MTQSAGYIKSEYKEVRRVMFKDQLRQTVLTEMSQSLPYPVSQYVHELTTKIVAETGIPSDKYHLGKVLLRCLKDAPEHILQIDGATDDKETFRSALDRSIKCATAFRNLGLQYQDVIVIMAPNCNDLVIPMYASLYLGIMTAGIDMTLGVNELKNIFIRCEPKIVFCQSERAQTVQNSLNLLGMSARIVVFGKTEDLSNYITFSELLRKHGGNMTADNFSPADFDTDETNALLMTTSGSTGVPKIVALTHKNLILGLPIAMIASTTFPYPVNMGLVISPVQWLTSTAQFILGPILRFSRVQTSSALTQEHVYKLINKYRPDFSIFSPTFLTTLLKPKDRTKCDFSSLKYLIIAGSAISKEILQEIKKVNSHVYVQCTYGMTEISSIMNPLNAVFGSVGSPYKYLQYRLVNPITNEVISEPKVTGELWVKGPTLFKGYYKNPEMTAAAFAADGWFKTGDLLYRDENHNYYYVDRLKLLLKYKNHQVSPVEIETVILQHPGVLDVAVTGIPDKECGDLPVAVVVPQEGYTLTEQEIQDLVKESLTDTKQLRGGVIFVKELPTTSTSKIDRQKIKQMAIPCIHNINK